MIGIATIGNATLIAYDDIPVLSTDPWFGDEDPAYFGSWICSHEIPNDYKNDILRSKYLWFSHGHPDHTNPISLERFKDNKILLPDHYGSRIYKDLKNIGYDVQVLKDKKWYQLSKNIRIQCITNWLQDSILLVEINNKIFINLNDSGINFYSRYIRKIVKSYKERYLLTLSGYGDADMINFWNENGDFIKRKTFSVDHVGKQLSDMANIVGAKNIIPFSSFHQYQRTDTIWAQEHTVPIDLYKNGIDKSHNFIDAFAFINCENDEIKKIEPKKLKIQLKKPEFFGDNWSDRLDKKEFEEVRNYFLEKKRLQKILGFIKIKVGGEINTIVLNNNFRNGVTFELPRNSLLTSVRYRIFDDLLIANFMRTTLHNMPSLKYKNFSHVISKWSDNGGVNTEEEINKYINHYNEKVGREFLYNIFLDESKNTFLRFVTKNSENYIYKFFKKIYLHIK
jgi:hypothetical protein